MFDPLLHATALRPGDLGDLRFFGIAGALVATDDSVVGASAAAAVRSGWEATAAAARRLRRAGLAGHAALGIPPRRIPLRGLEALLAELPAALDRPEVAAVGAVGLADGGELEERVLLRQLELARELRLPVVVTTGWRARERATKRLLALVREAELEPAGVLVAGADARTLRAVRACGHYAGVSLSASESDGRSAIDEAVRLVASLGPEGIALGSDAGHAGADLLALARAADRLAKAGLSDAVIRRVCGGNAVAFLGVEPRPLAAARRQRTRR